MGFGVGEQVGPYKITAYIGQGGMATIYRAYQAALDRDVALKVIHPALKEDQAFLARLRREAQVVARMNHANIVDVYDYAISEQDGTPYIVMRFIEGKTLKEVVQESQLTPHQILDIMRPVADALAYAHSHGVLHRDVKLSNIMLDKDGHVYLTDFGLARLTYKGESTLSHDMLIGSPQYISPEMAKGEAIDARADIYSLGVVLFEMLAGRLPFQADTPYATVMAHINEPVPSARNLNPHIPPAVDQVLAKAMAKSPEQRYQSVAELMIALENAIYGPLGAPYEPARASSRALPRPSSAMPTARSAPRGAPAEQRSSGRTFAAVIGTLGALAIAAICMLFVFFMGIQPTLQPTPTSPRLAATATPPVAVIPTITPTRAATPTESGSTTAPSPTRRTPTPATLKGKIAYTVGTGDRPEANTIWIADADGTDAHPVIDGARWPAFSPDGRQIAFYQLRENGIYTANLDGGNRKRAIGFSDVCCAQWSPDAKKFVFYRGEIQRFSGKIFTADIDGSDMVEIAVGFNPAWSFDGGRLAYSGCLPNTAACGIFIYDLRARTSINITRDNAGNPQWSPDGKRIVYQADDGSGHMNIFVVNSDGSGRTQLTRGRSNDGQPVFSRDGGSIFWRSDQNATAWAIYVMNADGTNPRGLIRGVPVHEFWGRESLSAAP